MNLDQIFAELDAEAEKRKAAKATRLADEYNAAQERGEVAVRGDNQVVPIGNDLKPTAADLGLTRKQVHDARKIRDAQNGLHGTNSTSGPPHIGKPANASETAENHTENTD